MMIIKNSSKLIIAAFLAIHLGTSLFATEQIFNQEAVKIMAEGKVISTGLEYRLNNYEFWALVYWKEELFMCRSRQRDSLCVKWGMPK